MTEPTTRIHLLAAGDEEELRLFEEVNRAYFARAVGDRGDDYFASFSDRHRALVQENEAGTSLRFLVRDGSGHLVGRVNLVDVADELPELGYRMAERAGGRGHARRAVTAALEAAAQHGVSAVKAMTTVGNTASRRVLEACGFRQVHHGEPATIEIDGRSEPVVHYTASLTATPGERPADPSEGF